MFNKEEEFDKIYRENYTNLLKVAYYFLDNFTIHSPQDVVNDVFLVLLKMKETKFKYPIQFYLKGICKNLCFSINRKGRKMNLEEIEHYVYKLSSNELEESYNLNELEKQVEDVLNKMPDRRAEVFRLSRFKGMKNKEIAKLLDITISTVEQHITKALRDLRNELKKLNYIL